MRNSAFWLRCSFNKISIYPSIYLTTIGNHTIAVVKGKEEYKTPKSSLSYVISDVNRLPDDPHMIIDGGKSHAAILPGRGVQGETSP